MSDKRVNTKEVERRLNAMAAKMRAATFRKVLRKASEPVVGDLRNAWAGAKRRRGLVSGDIADAQGIKITCKSRGKNAGAATLEIGADYRKRGYAKLWHILENGFKHYGGNSAYSTLGAQANNLKRRRSEFRKAALASMGQITKGKAGKAQARAAVRQAWARHAPGADAAISAAHEAKKQTTAKARSGKSSAIAGRKISRPIALKHVSDLADAARTMLAEQVMQAAKGRG